MENKTQVATEILRLRNDASKRREVYGALKEYQGAKRGLRSLRSPLSKDGLNELVIGGFFGLATAGIATYYGAPGDLFVATITGAAGGYSVNRTCRILETTLRDKSERDQFKKLTKKVHQLQ